MNCPGCFPPCPPRARRYRRGAVECISIILLYLNRAGRASPVCLYMYMQNIISYYYRATGMPWLTIRIPYGGMVYHANKISLPQNANFLLTMGAHCDTIRTVKDDTDGTPKGTPPRFPKLSICSARWMGWKSAEHRTLRTRLATDSRLNGKTTERTGWKNLLDNGSTK